jgi:5-methyltetrahydropteroyltriglutamate--homocysteine methyltransferase
VSKTLLTTAVGSYPKPDYITRARARVAKGEMGREELRELEMKATAHWIKVQEDLGMDLLVDGEMYRGDMVAYFAEEMEGFALSGLVRSYGNRYYHKPIAVGPVGRKSDMTVEWWRYAQSLTDKPVKGMLTGPYTIVDWSFNEHYPTREAFVLDVARAIHEEAVALEKAGARHIQIDEPAISVRPEEMELASRALGIVTDGLSAFTITHICYGDFAPVFRDLVRLPVDMLDLEMANSKYDLLESFKSHPTDKYLSMGVVDSHNHKVESVEQIKQSIRAALEVFPPDRLYLDPDCGMKTRLEDETVAKLRNIVAAAREVKGELGIE